MKQLFLKLALSILGLVVLTPATTQTVNMNNYITLDVQNGKWIYFSLSADNDGTEIKVSNGVRDTIIIIGTRIINGPGAISNKFFADSSTMFFYGDITGFSCYDNINNITNVDISNNNILRILYCGKNALNSLDVRNMTNLEELYFNSCVYPPENIKISGCTNLKIIDCFTNLLSACAIDSIFHQLPERSINNKGRIGIKWGESSANLGVYTCRDTIATNKNWDVVDYENDGSMIYIINSSYDCSYFTLNIEEIEIDNVSAKVYPNPTNSMLNIECSDMINSVILYDALGKELYRTKETKNIDVSTLTEGVYFLKLISKKGEGKYKVIKQ